MAAAKRRNRKSKFSPVQRFAVIGISLILVEGLIYVLFPKPHPPTAKDAITKAIEQVGGTVDDQRREQLRIQIAVQQYQVQHQGKPPERLEELVPAFLDKIPNDPTTGKSFDYLIANGRPIVGPAGAGRKATEGGTSGSTTLTRLEDILTLPDEDERARFIYDPTGKRDPYRPIDLTPKVPEGENVTPLEKYDIGQLKLTAVLEKAGDPTAIVENQVGRGFPVKKGTKIGLNGGVVADIMREKILILETVIDFTGQKKTNVVELTLRTKDQEKAGRR